MPKVIVIMDDGDRYDVTEAVESMYDSLVHSMDWGSQFLTIEDVIPIARLARLCEFKDRDNAERYMSRMLGAKMASVLMDIETNYPGAWLKLTEHDHVFGAQGVCVWPLCFEEEKSLDEPGE